MRHKLLILFAVFPLAGCSTVRPVPLSVEDLNQSIAADRVQISASVEPLNHPLELDE